MRCGLALNVVFGVIAFATAAGAQSPTGATVTLRPVTGGHTYSLVATTPGATTGYLAIFDQTAGQFRLVINPAGNVGIGTTNADRAKLFVVDTSVGTAVGGSTITSGSGVYGENTSGVYGSGFGVYGTNNTAWGVYGTSAAQLYAGVGGANSATNGFGVYGKATGPGGVGVYATSTQGFAMAADGNVHQQLDKGGWVKAMVLVNEDGTIARCYNGSSGASSGSCGFSVNHVALGSYIVDFGLQVSERFYSLTVLIDSGSHFNAGECQTPTNTSVQVYTYKIDGGLDSTNAPFILIVY